MAEQKRRERYSPRLLFLYSYSTTGQSPCVFRPKSYHANVALTNRQNYQCIMVVNRQRIRTYQLIIYVGLNPSTVLTRFRAVWRGNCRVVHCLAVDGGGISTKRKTSHGSLLRRLPSSCASSTFSPCCVASVAPELRISLRLYAAPA